MSAVFHHLGGVGPPVLMIHGFGADRLGWSLTSSALTDAFSVWAVDLPGHGSASNDVGDGTVGALADAVVAGLEFKPPFGVVGHSMGGAIALELARRGLVSRAVLIAPAGLGRDVNGEFLRKLPEIETEDDGFALLKLLVANPRLIARQMVGHVLGSLAVPGRREALRKIASGLRGVRDAQAIPNDVPMTVIWGAEDAVNSPPEQAPVKDYHLLARVGHLPQAEAMADVNRICRAALGAG